MMKAIATTIFTAILGFSATALGGEKQTDCSQLSGSDTQVLCQQNNKIIRILRRLEGGVGSGNGLARIYQGVLQVKRDDVWAGVCDDDFDKYDGEVACRMLGKSFVRFHPGVSSSGRLFHLDNLRCDGSEDSLFDCPHNEFGDPNCSRSEHIELICR